MRNQIQTFEVADIESINRLRPIDPDKVTELANSIAEIGLRTLPAVRIADSVDLDGVVENGVPIVVAGAHRIAAVVKLGWKTVECIVIEDENEARRWEIAENLHRAELTALERDEHIAEWIKLAQVAPVYGGRGNAGGLRAAARDLNVDRDDARRAVTVAQNLTPEAKAAAREVGLDDNRTALLEASKIAPENQVEYLHQRATRAIPLPLEQRNTAGVSNKNRAALMRAWNNAPAEDREWFLDEVQRPVFDRTRAGEAA